jgi:iron(III) transport system substrate-binding protein
MKRPCALAVTALVLMAVVGVPPSAGGPALTDAQQKWLREAQLGPYATAAHDWRTIEELARREGKVAVYSATSRIPVVARSFETAYPGIKVEAYDIGTVDAINKVKEEARARVRVGDVFFAGDGPTVLNELVPKGMLWNFVPSDLVAVLPQQYREPVLVQRLGTRVIIYNSEIYKTPPVTNWWDLTRPRWKGKVLLKDIYESGENLSMVVMFVKNADAFAQAYREAFGKEIVLDKDVPNAAFQWIKDFLANDPVFMGSDGDAAKAVGTRGQKEPPIAMLDYAKYRDVLDGKLFFEPALDVKPVGAIFYQTYLAVIDQAPHPNAAKLMIRWLMGDSRGGRGFAPFFVPGDYSPRTGMLEHPKGAVPMAVLKPKSWTFDPVYIYANTAKVLDFWVAHQRRR